MDVVAGRVTSRTLRSRFERAQRRPTEQDRSHIHLVQSDRTNGFKKGEFWITIGTDHKSDSGIYRPIPRAHSSLQHLKPQGAAVGRSGDLPDTDITCLLSALAGIKPLCRPDTMDPPSHLLENRLPEEVAVARCPGAVVSKAVTFDSGKVSPFISWIAPATSIRYLPAPTFISTFCPQSNRAAYTASSKSLVSALVPNCVIGRKVTIPLAEFQEIAK
jgi:hypothetical protein